MQTKMKYLCVGACVALLSFGQTQAQNPSPSLSGGSSTGSAYQGFVMGSKIAGCHVKDMQGADLGTISDVVANPGTGHIRFAVLNTGGNSVAVPWSALNVETMAKGEAPKFVLNSTKAKLEKAPKFDQSKLTQMFDRTMEEPVFTYYDIIWFPDMLTSDETSSKSKANGSPSPSPTSTSTSTSTP